MRPQPQRAQPQARRVVIGGRVQGVGFRPFVYRLARAHGVHGWVRNDGGRVVIEAEAAPARLDAFQRDLLEQAPPLSRPELRSSTALAPTGHDRFVIRASDGDPAGQVHVPPDQFTCDACLRELWDPADRRHRYPFINCTQCGPRYTLIRRLPYDRPNTTMADFELCPACAAEYQDPLDRRFHAEPLACPECGPRLCWQAAERRIEGNEPALAACVAALRTGAIVAVRGVGGYHLVCDAAHEAAIARLRARKHRPDKPLAVMVPMAGADGLGWIDRLASAGPAARQQLRAPERPIVLLPRRAGGPLAAGVSPGLAEVGLMLPYSPLHHLLLADFGAPLVATSGNRGGEPVITDPGEAEQRLADVVDGFLHHDRPIERPADDPVYREARPGRPRPLRLGRGSAPLELELPWAVATPTLALGGFLKNTVALAWGRRVVISPHIGDLRSPRARRLRERVAADLQRLYNVRAEAWVHDAHPGFPLPADHDGPAVARQAVYHHHAHASALMHEADTAAPMVAFVWDGIGFGEDGTLWGGEALVGGPGAWQRRGSLRPFRLPGGERAVEQPWRTALSLCWSAGIDWAPPARPELALLRKAWERGLNSPVTSAAGRLFDAAAALTGLVTDATFEGHGPMHLEAVAAAGGQPLPLPLTRDRDGIWRSDWAPLLPVLADHALPVAERAAIFHASLAQAIIDQAERLRAESGIDRIGLTGGVFQNRRLRDDVREGLGARGFRLVSDDPVPVNDAGLSYGQLVEAAARVTGPTD